MQLSNKWTIAAMLFAVWGLAASFTAGYYWLQYSDMIDRIGGIAISVNVGFDYGSGTNHVWHNDTRALTGMTVFKVTRNVANVTSDSASGFGLYVTSINGVASNATHGWVWWKWDTSMGNWTIISISSDAYAVADKETFLWYYESGWPPSPPT